jgi:hypothetical protein
MLRYRRPGCGPAALNIAIDRIPGQRILDTGADAVDMTAFLASGYLRRLTAPVFTVRSLRTDSHQVDYLDHACRKAPRPP